MMRGTEVDNFPFVCSNGSTPTPDPHAQELWKVVGVVGGSSSSVSIQLASLLRMFYIPQVGLLYICKLSKILHGLQ